MWQQYKKTAAKTQVFIFLALMAMFVLGHVPLIGIFVILIAMEIGAVIGAAWATRLTRKINKKYPLKSKSMPAKSRPMPAL